MSALPQFTGKADLAPASDLLAVVAMEPVPIQPPPLPIMQPATPVYRDSGQVHGCGKSDATERQADSAAVPKCLERLAKPVETREDDAEIPVLNATPAPVECEPENEEENSIEMWLGTHWFVRVGAVSILTGLVFLANYAYKQWIFATSPAVKVTLLYLFSFGVAGAGWLAQRWQEQLRKYGQVLMATGLAATYFTTYAAHYYDALKVIESPVLAGCLLMAIAGFIVWIADRKGSESLALLAVGLAYYTSVINEIGLFTLFSNLALTIAAVCFLMRHRWATLSMASLVATYGSFFFWRFYQDKSWLFDVPMPMETFWLGAMFLAGYWITFTAPVLLSQTERFDDSRRAGFLTLNNGAFFGFTSWTLHLAQPGHFWQWSLAFGSVLIGLSMLAARMNPHATITRDAYLSKGLILVTVGFLAHYSGPRLSLILAAQSTAMLVMGSLRNRSLLRGGAYLVAGLAAMLALDDFRPFDHTSLLMGMSVATFMIFNALWLQWREKRVEPEGVFCGKVEFFVSVAVVLGFLSAWHNVTLSSRAPVFAMMGLLCVASWYVLRLRELALMGQGFLALSHALWLTQLENSAMPWPWWNAMVVIACSLALLHWWQHQQSLPIMPEWRVAVPFIYAAASVFVAHAFLNARVDQESWLWLGCVLAVGIAGYGMLAGSWAVTGAGQWFLLFGTWKYFVLILDGHPSWWLALVPLLTLCAHGMGMLAWLRRCADVPAETLKLVTRASLVLRSLAVLMGVAWILEYVPMRERFWVFALVGMGLYLRAAHVKRVEVFAFSVAFTSAGFGQYWVQSLKPEMVYLPNALAVFALALEQQIHRRGQQDEADDDEPLHVAVIIVVSATLWWCLMRWVQHAGSGFYHTAAWAGLALLLFGAGLTLREATYRRCGMGLLALALGRVVLVDIWELETIYKIISCIGLGVVLLLLGFIYNKYQEQIRRWL